MTTQPAVSVVIATHHRPALLRRAVESVLAQAYAGELEVLVVFDACSPFEPVESVPTGRTVRVMENTRTRGLAGARNTGIVAATHDVIAFLDDDDVWLPGKLAAQLPILAERSGTVLVGCGIVVDDGRRRHERLVPLRTVRHDDLLRDSFAGLHPSTFVIDRHALLSRVGLVDESIPGSYGEDYDLVLRIASAAPIAVVDRPLVLVSWTGQSYFFGQWATYAAGLEYLLAKHPGFRADRRAYGRITGQIAFSHASAGGRADAFTWVRASLSRSPTELRSWLALAIALRLVSSSRVVHVVQRMGRGI